MGLLTELYIRIKGDNKHAIKSMKKADRTARRTADKMDKSFKKSNRSIGQSFKRMAGKAKLAWAAVGAAVGYALKKTINLAMDTKESINAVNVVFGEGAKRVLEFGKNAVNAVGLTSAEFNQLATTTGALLKDTGKPMSEVAEMTNELAVRAADMASVFNTDVKDAMSAINQAVRGETEAIRRYAGDVTDATLETYLMSQGINRSVESLTQQEKRLYRVQLIMKQTSDMAGDFANTSDSAANMTKKLRKRIAELASRIGTALLPAYKLLLQAINWLIDDFKTFRELTALVSYGIMKLMVLPLNILVDTIQIVLKGFTKLIQGVSHFVSFMETGAVNALNSAFTKLNETIEDVIKNMINKASQMFSILQKGAEKVGFDTIAEKAGKFSNKLKQMETAFTFNKLNELGNIIEKAGTEDADNLLKKVDKISKLTEGWSDGMEGVQGKVRKVIKDIMRAIGGTEKLNEALGGGVGGAGGAGNEAGKNIAKNIKEGFLQAAEITGKIGKGIADSFVSALKAGDAKEAAGSFVDNLSSMLNKAGWWGKIIATIIQVSKNYTADALRDFIDEIIKILPELFENIISNTLQIFLNPIYIGKLIGQIILALGEGIVAAFKQIGEDFRQWKGTEAELEEKVQIKIDTEEVTESINELKESIDDMNLSYDESYDIIKNKINDAERERNELIKEREGYADKEKDRIAALQAEIEKVKGFVGDDGWIEDKKGWWNYFWNEGDMLSWSDQIKKLEADIAEIERHHENINAELQSQIDTQQAIIDEYSHYIYEIKLNDLKYSQELNKEEKSQLELLREEKSVKQDLLNNAEYFNLTTEEQRQLRLDLKEIEEDILETRIEQVMQLDDEIQKLQDAGKTDYSNLELQEKKLQSYKDQLSELKNIFGIRKAEGKVREYEKLSEGWFGWLYEDRLKIMKERLKTAKEEFENSEERWELLKQIEATEEKIAQIKIKQITATDEEYQKKVAAGVITDNEVEQNQKLIDLYTTQLENIENWAKENGKNVEEIDAYWSVLTNINKLQQEEVELQKAKTEEIKRQNEEIDSQKTKYLSLQRKILEAQLRAQGLSQFQIERQLRQYDISALGAKRGVFSRGGFSMEELAGLSGEFSSLASQGFGISGDLMQQAEFFRNLPTATSITNDKSINFSGDAVGTLNTQQPVTVEMLQDLLAQIQYQTEGA